MNKRYHRIRIENIKHEYVSWFIWFIYSLVVLLFVEGYLKLILFMIGVALILIINLIRGDKK